MRKKIKFVPLFAAVLLYLFLDPYFMWRLNNTTPLYAFLGVFLLLVFFPNADIKTKGRGGLFTLFSILIVLGTLYEGKNVFGIIGTLCLLFVPFAKADFAKQSFSYFLSIYSVIIAISGVMWILSLTGTIHPIGNIPPLNELKSYNYNVYPFLVRPDTFYLLERFCGPFDEPGVVGTISALLLTVGKFNLKDKRLLIVFITGILSMSFFYYAIIAVYYTVYTFTISKDKIFGFILLAVLLSLVIVSLSNETFNEALWSRFMWDESSGTLAGDNRYTDNSRRLLANAISSGTIFFGVGRSAEFLKATKGDASLIDTVVLYGLIFVTAYYYVFAAYGWKYKKNIINYFLFLFVFTACLYQRPFLFQAEYLFLFSMMAMGCGDLLEEKSKKEKKHLNKQYKYK